MTWCVQLSGDPEQLRHLTREFREPHLRIVERDSEFVLEAQEFDRLRVAGEVQMAASELLAMLNGLAILRLGSITPIGIAKIEKRSPSGAKQIYVGISETIAHHERVSAVLTNESGEVRRIDPESGMAAQMRLARDDTAVAKVLRLMSESRFGWVEMYRIFEVIASDMGGIERVANECGVSKRDIERFKHTANSPDSTGDAARHGVLGGQPPKNPMSLDRAQGLIRSVIDRWMKGKEVP